MDLVLGYSVSIHKLFCSKVLQKFGAGQLIKVSAMILGWIVIFKRSILSYVAM